MVFRAVIRLFEKLGYESMTTLKIAEEAGINEATLYRKYGSKESLFLFAVNRSFEEAPLRNAGVTGNMEEDLVSVFDLYKQTFAGLGGLVPRLILEVERNPELVPALQMMKANLAVVASVFREYQERGLLQNEIPAPTMMLSFLSPLFSSGIGRILKTGDVFKMEGRDYIRYFLDGYGR